jgi:hypothetical protein
MTDVYRDDGDDGRAAHPAVPGLRPETADEAAGTSHTVDVDGALFTLRPDGFGGTVYTWLNGPDPGYGFAASPTAGLSLADHLACIRDFLAVVDPVTGHIEDD